MHAGPIRRISLKWVCIYGLLDILYVCTFCINIHSFVHIDNFKQVTGIYRGFVSRPNVTRHFALSSAFDRCIINLLTSFENNEETGAVYSESKINSLTQHENVTFVDGDTPWEMSISSTPDSTTKLSDFTDAELGDFLSRPLKIATYTWTPNQPVLFETFNPWVLYFSNADVLDKLRRFRNLRCNLRMKVLINGNPFYYGRAMIAYNPYLINDDITISRAFFDEDLIELSQKPHILLDPTSSQGGEMFLPFLWPENALDITNTGWGNQMGECTLNSFGTLLHANGGDDPITISIYAWTENLCVSVPTTNTVASPQSGVVDRELDDFGFPVPYTAQSKTKSKTSKKGSNTSSSDEFTRDGLISKPASAIAKAADMLTMIPVLAPYAKATSMVATKIGQVAKIFGYSRPQIVTDPQLVVPRYAGNMCNTDVPENVVRLTADSKNELTIDSRVMGLSGQDEMTLSSIVQRPAYYNSFEWAETKTPGDLLYSIKVLPTYVRSLGTDPLKEYHQTPISFGSLPFDMWQGTIKFRFVVVASEYHRGRMRIVYNPKTNASGELPFNQVYSTIIDISEDRDFEYEVKWADIRAWNRCPRIDTYSNSEISSTSAVVTGGTDYDNGTLSVYVVNELATPSTTASDISVLVWVSAGSDFALSMPCNDKLRLLSPFRPQSAFAPQSEMAAVTTDDSNAPLTTSEVPSFGTPITEGDQYLVYQGERIVSFRELLRRYYYHTSEFPSKLFKDTDTVVEIGQSDFPYYRGYDPSGQGKANATNRYNWCAFTLLNYLTPAYVMRRGGIRHKAVYSSKKEHVGSMMVYRKEFGDSVHTWNPRSLVQTAGLFYNVNRQILDTKISTLSGIHLTALNNNPVLEYECGFYTKGQRFVSARRLNYWQGTNAAHTILVDSPISSTEMDQRIDKFISIAEDFNLGLFIGAPVLYEYTDPMQIPEV